MFERNQYNAFSLDPDLGTFSYQGLTYRFEEVAHLLLYRVQTTQRVNLVKVGTPEKATLILTLANGKEIGLKFDESTFFMGINRNKKDDIKNLFDTYVFLSKMTFEARLQPYLNQIRDKGYFVYENCRFVPGEKIVFRDKEYPIKGTTFLQRYGVIEMRAPTYGLMDRLVRVGSTKNVPQFTTLQDQDVLFYLLEKYFSSVRWR